MESYSSPMSPGQWNRLERAIAFVDTLPYQSAFIDLARENSLSIASSFNQCEQKICIETSQELTEAVPFIAPVGARHIVIEDMVLTLERRGGFNDLTGHMLVNGQTIELTSNAGRFCALLEGAGTAQISAAELTRLCLIVAGEYVDEKPEAINAILDSMAADDSDIDKLETVVHGLGNVTGMSWLTIKSYFEIEKDKGIITKVTDIESPAGSDMHNQHHSIEPISDIGLWAGTIVSNHESTLDDPLTPTVRHGARYVTDEAISPPRVAIQEDSFSYPDTATNVYYNEMSPPHDTQYYAELCLLLQTALRNYGFDAPNPSA